MQKTTAIRLATVGVAILAAELCGSVPAQAAIFVANVTTYPALTPSFLNQTSYHTGTTGTASSFLDAQAYFRGVLGLFAYHGIGTASADFLSLGASSRVILNDFTPLEYASNTLLTSQAQANDIITVPGNGPGYFQIAFHLSGSGASSNASLINGGVFFTSGIGSNAGSGGVDVNSFTLGYLPTGDLQTPLVPITFGVPFQVNTFLQTSVVIVGSGDDIGPIDAGIFYGNTAAMTGVNVFDANGNRLTSFSILSESGTNYANIGTSPVPEPSSFVLLSLGVATILLRCRLYGHHGLRRRSASRCRRPCSCEWARRSSDRGAIEHP